MHPTKPPKLGRPEGSHNPDPRTRIERRLPHVYDAVLRRAEAGDAAAAALCADIVRNPDKYPGATNVRNRAAGQRP